jgi:hypothetical protein
MNPVVLYRRILHIRGGDATSSTWDTFVSVHYKDYEEKGVLPFFKEHKDLPILFDALTSVYWRTRSPSASVMSGFKETITKRSILCVYMRNVQTRPAGNIKHQNTQCQYRHSSQSFRFH